MSFLRSTSDVFCFCLFLPFLSSFFGGFLFVRQAFKTQEYAGREQAELYRLRFLSNVDPVDVRRTLYDLDPEETLVVVISKTFTTAETMLNARQGRDPNIMQITDHYLDKSVISYVYYIFPFGYVAQEPYLSLIHI